MTALAGFLAWPLRCLPTLSVAGIFPMIVPGCNKRYLHKTVALHLHDYAGKVTIGNRT